MCQNREVNEAGQENNTKIIGVIEGCFSGMQKGKTLKKKRFLKIKKEKSVLQWLLLHPQVLPKPEFHS